MLAIRFAPTLLGAARRSTMVRDDGESSRIEMRKSRGDFGLGAEKQVVLSSTFSRATPARRALRAARTEHTR